MKKLLYIVAMLSPIVASAETLELDDALRATYSACVGIDENLSDLKKMAGINTAVTAVGTGLGAGALTVGIIKANKDSQARVKYNDYMSSKPVQVQDRAVADAFFTTWEQDPNYGTGAVEYKELRQQSKTLGNWRTGLMAGNTATNIAGAIISGNNKVDADLDTQIKNCRVAVQNLKTSIARARIEGADITEATDIFNACSGYETVDVSKINTRGRGAMISSIVGATTGVAGTATSAVANTESVRKDDLATQGKKTDSDWDKEKNINTAANVLAGASTAASGVATVFNATQISAIKKVADVASKCTGVLK